MKRARKSKDWVPNFHEGSKKWRVTVPAKVSSTKKRYDKYFDSQDSAQKFIDATLTERTEHGKQAVTAEERQWISYARTELGSLSSLPEVIRHWKRTGSGAGSDSSVVGCI